MIKSLEYLQPLLLVLLGSFFTFWSVAYTIRKQWERVEANRKREIKAEKEFNALEEARFRLQAIKELDLFDTEESCKTEILSYNAWFFNNQPFLPSDFNNKWAGLRDSFFRLWQLKRDKGKWNENEFVGIHKHVNKLIEETFKIIDSRFSVGKISPEVYKKIK